MHIVYRYRTNKPHDGHISFDVHRGGTVLDYTENWNVKKGWEVLLDILVDTTQTPERRYFFLCNGGDDLTFLGDYPEAHYVASHQAKGYLSYLFETTHLSENERQRGRVDITRYNRGSATRDELSAPQKQFAARRPRRPRRQVDAA